MTKQQPKLMRLVNNPTVRRAVAWLAPIVLRFIMKRLTQKSTGKSSRKYVKNKAK